MYEKLFHTINQNLTCLTSTCSHALMLLSTFRPKMIRKQLTTFVSSHHEMAYFCVENFIDEVVVVGERDQKGI